MKDEILRVAQEVLTEDEVNKIIKEKFTKAVSDACDDAFRWGDVKDAIREKIKGVMVPYIESRDFSEFLPKLDTVLSEIVNSTALVENKEILENFKELMIEDEKLKVIKTSELFKKWCDYVADNVSTDGLEVEVDDSPSYEYVNCTMEVEEEDGRSWSLYRHANIVFECEHDEDMNFIIPISIWKDDKKEEWDIDYKDCTELNSLRYLNDFQIFLIKLVRNYTKIIIDDYSADDDIQPTAESECDWS